MKATKKLMARLNLKRDKIKKEKKLKGFTLVELIVVIAIIGVLAVLLIPNMMGKVKDAKLKTVVDAAAKIAEQTKIAISELDVKGVSVSSGDIIYAEGEPAATDPPAATQCLNLIKKAVPEFGNKYHGSIYIDNDYSVYVVCAENNSNYIGLYPAPKDYDAKKSEEVKKSTKLDLKKAMTSDNITALCNGTT